MSKELEGFENREFPMTNSDFSEIKALAYSLTGISLTDHKKNMIYGRLSRRIRHLNLSSFYEYCKVIKAENSDEITDFVNSITTNLTAFFRENHHFEFLKSTLIPELIKRNSTTKKIRIWSAGCSTGEEPYSIAMVLKRFKELNHWDVKILATDLDSNVVQKASEAVYAATRTEKLPDGYSQYVQMNKACDQVRVKDNVSELITFKQLNLLHAWPMKGPFDLIFCRNVVIYFDAETQKVLFNRYADLLTNNGHLFIGHSENLHNVSSRFSSLGRTIYKKVS